MIQHRTVVFVKFHVCLVQQLISCEQRLLLTCNWPKILVLLQHRKLRLPVDGSVSTLNDICVHEAVKDRTSYKCGLEFSPVIKGLMIAKNGLRHDCHSPGARVRKLQKQEVQLLREREGGGEREKEMYAFAFSLFRRHMQHFIFHCQKKYKVTGLGLH